MLCVVIVVRVWHIYSSIIRHGIRVIITTIIFINLSDPRCQANEVLTLIRLDVIASLGFHTYPDGFWLVVVRGMITCFANGNVFWL